MKLFAITVAAALALPILFARAGDEDPLSTMQALKEAERAFDLDRALSLFADDAVIVNAAGATTAGMENLRRFLDEDMQFNDSFELKQPRVDRNQVSWTESVSADFYRKLGVAPVRFAFTAIVNQRKIASIVAHVPLEEIARIEAACRRTTDPVIYGQPCSQYIQYLRHQAVNLAAMQSAHAADIEAGKQLATTVCAACHGPSGVSVSDTVPNLAGQRARYIEAQLKFFKDGTRKEPGAVSRAAIMNAIAAQLSTEEIANVAAYFESLPGAAPGSKSALLPNIAATKVAFPEDYKQAFTKYHTRNFPAAKEVRYYYANTAAAAAAKAGKPLPDGSVLFVEVYSAKLDANNNPITGADGFYVPDRLLRYTAMEREAGWGFDIPELLRNESWNYAIFTAAKQYQQGVNQAECLACHKPLSNVSYTFTLQQLSAAK